MHKLRSYRRRPPHLGPYPLEKLARRAICDPAPAEPAPPLSFLRADNPASIVNAMREYQAMLDATRDGLVKRETATIPDDPAERARHLKAFGYFCDAPMVGVARIPAGAWRDQPLANPDVGRLAAKLRDMQPKSMAAGIDVIMAGLRDNMARPPEDCRHHSHALVFLYDYPRDPTSDEAGADWIADAQAHRACLRGAETAVTLATYLRSLGHEARAHSMAASDVDLMALAEAAGLVARGESPFVGRRFGLAAVTTTLELEPDLPLVPGQRSPWAYRSGLGAQARSQRRRDPYARRRFRRRAAALRNPAPGR